jgi:hypothetical protein
VLGLLLIILNTKVRNNAITANKVHARSKGIYEVSAIPAVSTKSKITSRCRKNGKQK